MSTLYCINTLGPEGTNCEEAARFWLKSRGENGNVVLHRTLEDAVDVACSTPSASSLVLGCIVYPDLHHLMFRNRARLHLRECFVMPTIEMVLASNTGAMPTVIASHPAPVDLIKNKNCKVNLVTSNSVAAQRCSSGDTDGCVTTLRAAELFDLHVVESYGQISMGFTIHESVSHSA